MSQKFLLWKYEGAVKRLKEKEDKSIWEILALESYYVLDYEPISNMRLEIMIRELEKYV